MASTGHESPMFLECEMVRHASQIIGHGAMEALALGKPGELGRQPVRSLNERIERLAKRLLRFPTFREYGRMPVHVVEQKAFQTAFLGRQLGGWANEERCVPNFSCTGEFSLRQLSLGDDQHVAYLPVDHFMDHRAPQLTIIEIGKTPSHAIPGLVPER